MRASLIILRSNNCITGQQIVNDYYFFGMLMPGRNFSIDDNTARRVDTIPDIPCDDHFEDGIAGWQDRGKARHVNWDSVNEG